MTLLFSEIASLYMRKHSVLTHHDNLEPADDSDCPEENVEEMNRSSASMVRDVIVKTKNVLVVVAAGEDNRHKVLLKNKYAVIFWCFCFKLNANIEKVVKSAGSETVKVCAFVNIFTLSFCVVLEGV